MKRILFWKYCYLAASIIEIGLFYGFLSLIIYGNNLKHYISMSLVFTPKHQENLKSKALTAWSRLND